MMNHDKLRELAEAATPGPWVLKLTEGYRFDEDNGLPATIEHPIDANSSSVVVDDENGDALNTNNAEYIAAANPTVVIALLDELRDAKAKLADAWEEGERTAMEDIFGEGNYLPGTPNPYRDDA